MVLSQKAQKKDCFFFIFILKKHDNVLFIK